MFSIYNKYTATALISFSIWIVANIINAILFAFIFSFAGNGDLDGIGIVLLFSAAFSLPDILIFWMVFLVKCRKNNLFPVLLITAASVSLLSVVLFFLYLAISFGADRGMWIIIVPVLAAIAATAIHRRAINDVVVTQNEMYESKNSATLET
ncbi:MAG: hypothetical protein V4685_00235 [Bacteroidota bacterium]